jgi:hypothetical protein
LDWFSREKLIKHWGFPVNKTSHDPCFCEFFTIQLGGIFSASYWDLILVNQPKRWLDTNSDCTFSTGETLWNIDVSHHPKEDCTNIFQAPTRNCWGDCEKMPQKTPCWNMESTKMVAMQLGEDMGIMGAKCTVHELYPLVI